MIEGDSKKARPIDLGESAAERENRSWRSSWWGLIVGGAIDFIVALFSH